MNLNFRSIPISKQYVFAILSLLITSCSSDDKLKPVVPDETPDPIVNDLENPDSTIETDLGTVEYFNEGLVDDNYILVNDASAHRVYLMDKKAELVHEWPLNGKKLGFDAFLMDDGKLLIMFKAEDSKIELGGFGGKLQILNKNGSIAWNFDYSTEDHIMHHDVEMLPNGNVVIQIWKRRTAEEAQMAGSDLEIDLFPDGIIEVDPSTDEIVWEWNIWDHLVQNHDDSKNNFGVVADNPQLIDLNYVTSENGSRTHANGIEYDAINDLIYLSVNFYSEVWVIDHSTTTEDAASHANGNLGKGGDLIYRFGNPEAYDNTKGERLFDHNHFPNLLDGSDIGRIFVFSNGFTIEQSTAYELKLPNPLKLEPNTDNEPEVTWSFTHETLFSAKVSGVVKLSNGNRLITEGDAGFWEVTDKGEVVWRFRKEGFFWRGYHYEKDSPGIVALGL